MKPWEKFRFEQQLKEIEHTLEFLGEEIVALKARIKQMEVKV